MSRYPPANGRARVARSLPELAEESRVDRCGTEHAAPRGPGDAGRHDILSRQVEAGDGRGSVWDIVPGQPTEVQDAGR